MNFRREDAKIHGYFVAAGGFAPCLLSEEGILALQERKAALADSEYSGSAARKELLFNAEDLAELLKPLG